jgi:hypothetical protein
VRKNVSVAGLLLAWLCANGAVWDIAQVFAWGRMFVGYTQTMTVAAALRETFNPAKPCEMCVTVSTAKTAEQQQAPVALERAIEKLVLVCESPAPIIFVASSREWPAVLASAAPGRVEAVPVPPPRG